LLPAGNADSVTENDFDALHPVPSEHFDMAHSIRALAEQLGLSISTVSRALNGYKDVNADTRQRVIDAARASGYRPNPTARRLVSGKTGAIGLIAPITIGEFGIAGFSRFVEGAASRLYEAGYYLLANALPTAAPDREAYDRFIGGGWVDGVILRQTLSDDPRIHRLQATRFPFASYGRTAEAVDMAWVDADDEAAFRRLTARLLARGHRRLALINAPEAFNFARLRRCGFEQALAAAGVSAEGARVVNLEPSESIAHQATLELLAQAAPPTALICASDAVALAAMAACRERGLEPGRDIAVTGFGNTPASAYAQPPLTTLESFEYDNGRQVASLLLRRLAGEPAHTLHHLVTPRLVERDSDAFELRRAGRPRT
jgi:LacI family transcriptional regulator